MPETSKERKRREKFRESGKKNFTKEIFREQAALEKENGILRIQCKKGTGFRKEHLVPLGLCHVILNQNVDVIVGIDDVRKIHKEILCF